MKTVEMFRDYDYLLHPRKTVRFRGGVTYARVLEAAAREIERAGAGRIALPSDPVGTYMTDAGLVFIRTKGER